MRTVQIEIYFARLKLRQLVNFVYQRRSVQVAMHEQSPGAPIDQSFGSFNLLAATLVGARHEN